MKMQTHELTGPALDWAVAQASGTQTTISRSGRLCRGKEGETYGIYMPSSDWAQGGPIIERELLTICFDVEYVAPAEQWFSNRCNSNDFGTYFGPTPLVAAMRCYVAVNLGTAVEVPDELCGGAA